METKSKSRGNGRIKSDLFPIRVNVGLYLQDCIEQELKNDLSKTRSITTIIRDALELYFKSKLGVRVISEVKTLENLSDPETSSVVGPPKPIHKVRQEVLPELHLIRRALRAKEAGLEYNQLMEQHFHLLNE